jgi:limonene-1,2-epoxide hydrolase
MPDRTLPPPLDRLVHAVNTHDLQTLVACFTPDYVNRTPAHPGRGFVGRDQVRRNWAHIFAAVPDVRARVLRFATDGASVWSEWQLSGTRVDASGFLMTGVLIFEVPAGTITAATFYLEPVEHLSGTADQGVRQVASEPSHFKEPS